ncbi:MULTISPECIES: hypothetical protein [unclassified Massilia]|uniref:hypothetical protein n=1 Tax=unclassified Massilia TaxID=2609279 RepID=UPI00177F9E93|nr:MULTISPECIES: hypothetical protein [unclassified Massilia]MBD8531460.1 hypothetical protein [Massilia sp. CFBP 13647]MBD8673744.1 hypothetical protein [Massilia sp. CFBP 13721]
MNDMTQPGAESVPLIDVDVRALLSEMTTFGGTLVSGDYLATRAAALLGVRATHYPVPRFADLDADTIDQAMDQQQNSGALDMAATLQEREHFEAQMRTEGVENFMRRPSGRYDNMVLEWHWLGWRGRARAGEAP